MPASGGSNSNGANRETIAQSIRAVLLAYDRTVSPETSSARSESRDRGPRVSERVDRRQGVDRRAVRAEVRKPRVRPRVLDLHQSARLAWDQHRASG